MSTRTVGRIECAGYDVKGIERMVNGIFCRFYFLFLLLFTSFWYHKQFEYNKNRKNKNKPEGK